MGPITITVVDSGGREHTKMLSSEEGYNRVLREFAVLFLVLDLGNGKSAAIEDFGSLADGGKYTLGERVSIVAAAGSLALSDSLMKQVWYSVLRIDNEETGDRATCLIFDIHKDESGPFLLILLNKHFKFKKNEILCLSTCEDEELFVALKFMGKDASSFQDGGALDFIIYKVRLDTDEWDTQEPGKATRREEVAAKPSKRPKRSAAPTPMKRAAFICKTPRYTYEMRLSMPVRVFGFPAAVNGRWQADTTIASIERDAFYLQTLSCPGLSGGAVVASHLGQIVGIIGGAMDATEEGNEKRFSTYAIPAHSLPRRPSSQPPSPENIKKSATEDNIG